MNPAEDSYTIENAKREKFAGAEACASCHKDIYNEHLRTAHFLTSQIASAENIKGSFETGHNAFAFNDSVSVTMEKTAQGFFQVENIRDIKNRTRRFDIVIGSGTMGQSFLNWRNNELFQLPITYFTAANEWSNSPGFPDKVLFNRVITSRCLECHTTFASVLNVNENGIEEFNRGKMILGVTCEKCHGAGEKHVEFQQQNPNVRTARYIINPAKLTRQQKLDLCALCHGGRLEKTQPSFTFAAGDTLSNYFHIDTAAPDPDKVDVHGNQYALLRASKCFRLSTSLTCNTCHDTHKNERGQMALFSERCQSCHNGEEHPFCKMKAVLGNSINSNCIDCHMPVKSSRAIAVFLPGDTLATAAKIRSHYISIYPDESKKLAAMMINTSKQ